MAPAAAGPSSPLASAVSRQREAAREQLSAAWRLQMYRVEEALEAGWRDQVDRIIDDRFAELAAGIAADFESQLAGRVDQLVPEVRERARHESIEEFHQAARRLHAFESEARWGAVVLDSVLPFSGRAVLLALSGGTLRFFGSEAGSISLNDAPAIRAAIESQDTVVTLAAASEVSEPVASRLAAGEQCAVLPIAARSRTTAVLVAGGTALNVAGLESIALLASSALERRAGIPSPEEDAAPRVDPEWDARARRFSRVRVAEMRLYHSCRVLAGRGENRIYAELKDEIDSARAEYEREFSSRSLPDYLHLELVRTLANNDVAVLGQDYPGPLA